MSFLGGKYVKIIGFDEFTIWLLNTRFDGGSANFQGSAPNLQAIWTITFVATDFNLPGSKPIFFSVTTFESFKRYKMAF